MLRREKPIQREACTTLVIQFDTACTPEPEGRSWAWAGATANRIATSSNAVRDERIGFWVNLECPYFTSAWRAFRIIHGIYGPCQERSGSPFILPSIE